MSRHAVTWIEHMLASGVLLDLNTTLRASKALWRLPISPTQGRSQVTNLAVPRRLTFDPRRLPSSEKCVL